MSAEVKKEIQLEIAHVHSLSYFAPTSADKAGKVAREAHALSRSVSENTWSQGLVWKRRGLWRTIINNRAVNSSLKGNA